MWIPQGGQQQQRLSHWFCLISLAWLHSCLLNVQKRLLWINGDLYNLLCRENTFQMTVSKAVNGIVTVNCILLSAQKPWLHIYGLNIIFVMYLVPKQRIENWPSINHVILYIFFSFFYCSLLLLLYVLNYYFTFTYNYSKYLNLYKK